MFSKSNSQIHTLSHTHVNKFQTDKQKLRTARLCFIKKHAHFGVCVHVCVRRTEQWNKNSKVWIFGFWVQQTNKKKKVKFTAHCQRKSKKRKQNAVAPPFSPQVWSHEIFIVDQIERMLAALLMGNFYTAEGRSMSFTCEQVSLTHHTVQWEVNQFLYNVYLLGYLLLQFHRQKNQ